MKALCFLHSFEPGGVERTALRLCAQLRKNGLTVDVVIGRDEGAMRGDVPDLAYRLLPSSAFPIRWIESLWMILWLPSVIRATRPDILFCAGNSFTVVAVAMKLLLRRRCPPIVAKISNDLSRQDMPRGARAFYALWCRIQGRLIDHWIALSPAMAEQSKNILGVASDRVETILNPILDAGLYQALVQTGVRSRSSRQPGRRCLASGRLVRQKDVDMLNETFAQGAQPMDRLVIVGEGQERRRLARKIARLGLSDRVQLPGPCHSIDSYMACSDIFILTSRYEGLPAVIPEAVAAGLRIIATDCCASMRDLVGDRHPGQVVRPQSPGALTLCIALARLPDQMEEEAAPASPFLVEAVARAYQAAFARLAAAEAVAAPAALIGEPA
jgi:glycosyltransferase involved in cell wall biosynthesis